MPRQIKREVVIAASREKVFDALIKPSAIKQWWFANSAIVYAKANGHYVVSWGPNEDHPEYINAMRISVFEPPAKLALSDFDYFSKTGPLPFKAELQTEFFVAEENGKTKLTVIQSGFPDSFIAEIFYLGSVVGWETTLASIKKFLEG
ncbi:MAG: SRPBCC domain-containing protein [Bacteroidia bacterium]|nr:SRPBCC domain-containing protein [Bacteroidia bacterium]